MGRCAPSLARGAVPWLSWGQLGMWLGRSRVWCSCCKSRAQSLCSLFIQAIN